MSFFDRSEVEATLCLFLRDRFSAFGLVIQQLELPQTRQVSV
jgi:hypothetical protein